MFRLVLLPLLLLPSATAADDDATARLLFDKFKREHRTAPYADFVEEATRFLVFQSNMATVARLNEGSARSGRPDAAVFGVTRFSDLTMDEYRNLPRRSQVPKLPVAAVLPSPTQTQTSADPNPHLPYVPPAPVTCSRNWAVDFPSVSGIRDQVRFFNRFLYLLDVLTLDDNISARRLT